MPIGARAAPAIGASIFACLASACACFAADNHFNTDRMIATSAPLAHGTAAINRHPFGANQRPARCERRQAISRRMLAAVRGRHGFNRDPHQGGQILRSSGLTALDFAHPSHMH